MFVLECLTSAKTDVTKAAAVIILISSDIDFRYCLSRISEPKYSCQTILLHGRNARESLVNTADFSYDWYSLVRGIKDPKQNLKLLNKNWIEELQVAIEDLFSEKLILNETNIRAKLKLAGRTKNEAWNTLLKKPEFSTLITQASKEQKTMEHYDPTEANWENFNVAELKILYTTITKYRGEKRAGKYALSLFIQEKSQDREFPLGKVMEFVELSVQQGWIQKTGRYYIIQQMILQQFPYREIFAGELSTPQPQIKKNVSKIAKKSAKSALQHYFQKTVKSLPQYECLRSGPDHAPCFEATVRVPLPDGFVDSYFYASGVDSTKKDAEKDAAFNACNTLLERYLGDSFSFPSYYLES